MEPTPENEAFIIFTNFRDCILLTSPGAPYGNSAGMGSIQENRHLFDALIYFLQVNFSNAIHEEERYGGVNKGGFLDRYYRTQFQDVYVLKIYNSPEGVEEDTPSSIILKKFRLN